MGDWDALLQTCGTAFELLYLSFAFSAKRRTLPYWGKSSKGPWKWRTWYTKRHWSNWTSSPWRKDWENLLRFTNTSWKDTGKTDQGFSYRSKFSQGKSQWAQVRTQENSILRWKKPQNQQHYESGYLLEIFSGKLVVSPSMESYLNIDRTVPLATWSSWDYYEWVLD